MRSEEKRGKVRRRVWRRGYVKREESKLGGRKQKKRRRVLR